MQATLEGTHTLQEVEELLTALELLIDRAVSLQVHQDHTGYQLAILLADPAIAIPRATLSESGDYYTDRQMHYMPIDGYITADMRQQIPRCLRKVSLGVNALDHQAALLPLHRDLPLSMHRLQRKARTPHMTRNVLLT